MKQKLKLVLPHLIAVAGFYLITMLFFWPTFQGKVIYQGDIVNFAGMSKEIVDFRDKTGEEPLWTNSMFCGMPAYQISVMYDGNLMGYVLKIMRTGIYYAVSPVFMGMLGFYLLMLVLGIHRWISISAAIAFAFSTYFIVILEAGHNSKATAIALMPYVLASIFYAYRINRLYGSVFVATALALEILANHVQMTYYLGIILVLVVLAEGIRSIRDKAIASFIKTSTLLVFATILAVSTNFSNLYNTYEYSKYTIRGKSELTLDKKENQTSGLDKDYITMWSYGISESFTLLIPNFKGGGSGAIGEHKEALKSVPSQYRQQVANMDSYFGDQPFTSGPVYVGAIVCFLFVLGLFVLQGPTKWALVISFLLTLTLSWGKYFMGLTNFFLDYVPMYNKFRAVSSILVDVEFIMPLVAFWTLHQILNKTESLEKLWKPVLYSGAIVGGFCLLSVISPDLVNTFSKTDELEKTTQQYVAYGAGSEQEVKTFLGQMLPYVEEAREAVFTADALRSFFFVFIGFVLLALFVKDKIKANVVMIGIGVLVFLDMWSVNKRYLNEKNYVNKNKMERPVEKTAVDEQILADPDLYYRVYNTTMRPDQDSKTSYYHKSLGGYHAAKLRRYQDMIDYHFNRGNRNVFNMLNTKYYIVKDQNGALSARINPEALGNAWFVHQYKLVQNADSEIMALTAFNPSETAIVDQIFKSQVDKHKFATDSMAKITLTAYKPNQLTYSYESAIPQFTVFSDIYYKDGWNAYLDGQKVNYFRVNYVLRAMIIPSGKHTIEFKFEPETYYMGEKVSFASSSVLILLLLVALGSIGVKWFKTT